LTHTVDRWFAWSSWWMLLRWLLFSVSNWDVSAVDFDESRPWQQRFVSHSVRCAILCYFVNCETVYC